MIIGYDNFGGMPDSQFDTRLSPYAFNYVRFNKGVYDEIFADNDATMTYSTAKKEWGTNTIFLATFDNTFECGNIQQADEEIELIRFKKRLKGELDWIFIEEKTYSREIKLYTVVDRLAYSLDDYEYAVFPVSQGIEGDAVVNSIECEYDGLWIVDSDESYRLFYDVEYGDISHINNISEIELLERQYPMTNSTILEYDTGSNSAVIVADKTGKDGVNVDYLGDRKLIDKVVKFLRNRKPKVMKDGNGVKKIVITKNVSESSKDGFKGGVCTISFDWVEIGNATLTEDLVKNGLLPENAI